jgi:hypothetical protein
VDAAAWATIWAGTGSVLTGVGGLAAWKHKNRDSTKQETAFYELVDDLRTEIAECHKQREHLTDKVSKLTTHVIALERGWRMYHEGGDAMPDDWGRFVQMIRREVAQVQADHPLEDL